MTAWATVADLRAYLPQIPLYGLQSVALADTSGGDTFTLVYSGSSTSALPVASTAAAVQTALRAISAIGSSGVNVSGPAGGPFLATFQGALQQNAVPLTGAVTGAGSITIAPAQDELLQDCLDRATDLVRDAIRSSLDDPAFDLTAFTSATTAIVRAATTGAYLRIPVHQAGSVTLVEYQSTSDPIAYSPIADTWIEEGVYLYRPAGWGGTPYTRYRITANYGYGSTIPPGLAEIVLEQAVNIWRSKDKGGFSETIGVDGQGASRQVAGLNKLQMQQITNVASQWIVIGV